MILVSSFTKKLLPRALSLLESIKDNTHGLFSHMYYENTESTGKFIKDDTSSFNWVDWINLNSVDSYGLDKIDSFEQFEAAKNDTERELKYWNYHARFWFRKIAAVRSCMINNPKNDILIWVDADSYVKKPIYDNCVKTAQLGDIGCIKRTDKPTDTGLILFNLKNPLVKEFIEDWYQLYITGNIFTEIKYWADHYAFDHVLSKEKYASLVSYNIKTCSEFDGVIRHKKQGHKEMVKLRDRC